jgi:hypothetical protein
MLLLVWILLFCPKLTQESPDRCGEAISPPEMGGGSHRSLWGIDIRIDIIPSRISKMFLHRVRHSAIKAALDVTGGNIRKVQKLSRRHLSLGFRGMARLLS